MILSPTEAADFFTLLASLDTFTNRQLRVVPGLDDPDAMREAPLQQRHRIRQELWGKPTLLDDFVETNPFELSRELLADASLFRHAVSGRFFVERVLKKHAIFILVSQPTRVYAVEGLTEPIGDVLSRMHARSAVMLDAVLLPYRGRIVWDGIVSALPIHFGSGIRRSYKALYDRAKDRGEILETLGEVAREAKPARRRAPDWRPAVDQIAAEALGRTDTALQGAAFTLLKQSARLAQAAVGDDREGIREAVRKAERALRKVLGSLED
jgi:hypothetical protein